MSEDKTTLEPCPFCGKDNQLTFSNDEVVDCGCKCGFANGYVKINDWNNAFWVNERDTLISDIALLKASEAEHLASIKKLRDALKVCAINLETDCYLCEVGSCIHFKNWLNEINEILADTAKYSQETLVENEGEK